MRKIIFIITLLLCVTSINAQNKTLVYFSEKLTEKMDGVIYDRRTTDTEEYFVIEAKRPSYYTSDLVISDCKRFVNSYSDIETIGSWELQDNGYTLIMYRIGELDIIVAFNDSVNPILLNFFFKYETGGKL